MKTHINPLKHYVKPIWVFVSFILVGIIGVIDYLTGYELAFSLFYLIPIILVVWQTGIVPGIIISIVSALVWFLADMSAGSSYSRPIIYFWNTLIRFCFFLITVTLLTSLRKALDHERELSRVDSMTGAINSRFFSALLQMEIDRCRRYKTPFTIVYLDLDNFKAVNDQYGHSTGDLVLRNVVQYFQMNLRKTDLVTRLGGDEFALLLPQTDQESASILISRIQPGLLQDMQKNNWSVTFSIGVLTCLNAPPSMDEVIKRSDDLMYTAKKSGKNAITYATCSD